jgi:hypothetical protein
MRNKNMNTAAYGYGERDDMVQFIAQGKKTKYDIPEAEEIVPLKAREGNVGKWEATPVVSTEEIKEGRGDGVKKEESDDDEDDETGQRRGSGTEDGKRGRDPDQEDLFRFKVQEKVFPTDVKDEDEEIKVPSIGFKKRKVGNKSSRVSGAL